MLLRLSRSLLRQAVLLWRAHRTHLITNTAYAAALAAAAGALVTQTTTTDLLAALAAGLLTVHRALRGDRRPQHSSGSDTLEGDIA